LRRYNKGELGFALANFLGAVQYIRSDQMAALLRRAAREGAAWDGTSIAAATPSLPPSPPLSPPPSPPRPVTGGGIQGPL
jgi:hypothetical protein